MAALYFLNPDTGEFELQRLVGHSGPTGPTGPPGTPGNPGTSGPTGPTGNTGSAGATGPRGATGPAGGQGGPGPTGPTGGIGVKGLTGPVGNTGAKGATGGQGATGAKGPSHPAQLRVGSTRWTPTPDTASQGPWTAFSAPFAGNPQCVMSMRSSGVGSAWVGLSHTGLNTSGFYPVAYRLNSFDVIVDWLAVSARAARSAGSAQYEGEARHVHYVQTPLVAAVHEVVESVERSVGADGSLRLLGAGGQIVREYGPTEWTSVQHEYIIGEV